VGFGTNLLLGSLVPTDSVRRVRYFLLTSNINFSKTESVKLIDGLPVWGEPQQNAVDQMQNCMKTAYRGALMADHHLGYAVPIGGVIAYEGQISPSGVGFDIACGNKAVLTDLRLHDISLVSGGISKIMDDIFSSISFGVGRVNDEKVDHDLFDDEAWEIPIAKSLKSMAMNQLGTVGSGNHYVDIFHDEESRVWIGVHFGSRGLGHKLATHFIKEGGGKDGINVDPVVLDVDSELGREYIACMNLAGRYAYAGRDWACQKVASIVGAEILEEVHNHHNFAWQETHGGKSLWAVRKGATPAFRGQKGFVGGTMGENSVILEGVDHPENEYSMHSTVHGAGRMISRSAAKGKFVRDENGKKQRQPGLVRHDEMMKWIADKGVELRGAGVDEAPQCYKRLDEVLGHHSNSIKILHTLTPIGVAMAGKEIDDPYKD